MLTVPHFETEQFRELSVLVYTVNVERRESTSNYNFNILPEPSCRRTNATGVTFISVFAGDPFHVFGKVNCSVTNFHTAMLASTEEKIINCVILVE